MTAAEVLKLAKSIHGNGVRLEERKHALTADKRESAIAEYAAIVARRDYLRNSLTTDQKALGALLAAAEFVVDVDAQEPSLAQLRAAVDAAKRHVALANEYRDVSKRSLDRPRMTKRWWLVEPRHSGFLFHIADADTLEEMYAALAKKEVVTLV